MKVITIEKKAYKIPDKLFNEYAELWYNGDDEDEERNDKLHEVIKKIMDRKPVLYIDHINS